MGRDTGTACKQCRREGMKLFLKGARCHMAKCAIEQERPVPGMHGGGRRRGKLSDYGVQLREKQKLRRIYGLREHQFRLFFARASRKKGLTGESLLQMLECRLDNLVFRLGFAPSRRAARHYVSHGHVHVNGHKATIPSMILKQGDIVSVRDKGGSREYAKRHIEEAEGRGATSPWLSLEKAQLRGELLHVPSREEIAPTVNEQLIVELYSK